MNSMLANFAREIPGKGLGENWVSRWIKAHLDKVISRFSSGLDSDKKKADAFLHLQIVDRPIMSSDIVG
jgi:hypothetical protein